ncbi:hypothetical protein MIMGU_mgv1a015086mg [Erythranthe guttata]|uniref:RING-CH-type domain-containing protein n=1 Tax=Erythranthe guttata TaxID=4155 RepID=A0A022QF99_ERYGU|nr:PREDICTED: uncharacterized protein LOC105970060 [Erythranthe guttata]EYU26631.1 hypothetical protein MIMGU_mgv1a015086mg [Erythranthe guttata]|eukprot:XP_012850294.1 PREDICTED: uncharacterized protein LOC105970060 [Erythranthe guttata]
MGTTIELMPHADLEEGGGGGGGATSEEEEEELGRECRICHMSLVSCSSPAGSVSRVGIELGCCCKDDLAAAHRHCAETWFKIKGNKICEICNSTAQNVVGPDDITEGREAEHGGTDSNLAGSSDNSSNSGGARESWSWLNGHRFLNFILACFVFAFVISWLFHFNLPS